MRAIALATGALLLMAAGPNPQTPFRIAVLGAEGPCAAPATSAPAGEQAYAKHLQARLGREVRHCPYPDAAAAALALAAGEVDIAPLDPAAFATVADQARAVMTVREKGALNRIPSLVAVKAGAPYRALADLKGRRVVVGGAIPAARDLPKRALADHGAGEAFFGAETIAADEEAALADLRAGRADAAVLHAGAWRRQCRGLSPSDRPCADLAVVWKARPRAAQALAVRNDMPDPLRFQLIGVHVALHLEAPEAFAWAAPKLATNPESFEAAEAQALTLALMK